MKHYLLQVVFVLTTGIMVMSCSGQNKTSESTDDTTTVNLLPATDFNTQMHTLDQVQLVDVRTPQEFSGGYIKGAVNMDFNGENFSVEVKQLDKEKPVMVYCKGGGRSGQAAELLKEQGFKQVYDLDGGIMAWQNNDLPLEKGSLSKNANRFKPGDLQDVVEKNELVLVDFYATWCAPCKKMKPILEQLSREYKGKVNVVRVNADEAADLCRQLKIEGLPVVITYKNGAQLRRVKGEQTETELRALVEELDQK